MIHTRKVRHLVISTIDIISSIYIIYICISSNTIIKHDLSALKK